LIFSACTSFFFRPDALHRTSKTSRSDEKSLRPILVFISVQALVDLCDA
jgi:hypothetical protein